MAPGRPVLTGRGQGADEAAMRSTLASADARAPQSVIDGSAEYAAICRVEYRRSLQKLMAFLAPFGEQPLSADDAGNGV